MLILTCVDTDDGLVNLDTARMVVTERETVRGQRVLSYYVVDDKGGRHQIMEGDDDSILRRTAPVRLPFNQLCCMSCATMMNTYMYIRIQSLHGDCRLA